jgi:hypothetical protein
MIHDEQWRGLRTQTCTNLTLSLGLAIVRRLGRLNCPMPSVPKRTTRTKQQKEAARLAIAHPLLQVFIRLDQPQREA